MLFLGELAALGTAFCWAGGTMLFTIAGRLMGSYNVNKLRIPVSAVFLAVPLLVRFGTVLPTGFESRALAYLAVSGIVGLAIGDTFYFRCLVILGSRQGALMMSLAPVLTAIFAFFLIGERLSLLAIAGILVTLGGVTWVTTDKKDSRIDGREGSRGIGILMGIGGAAGQALGLVLAKEGMGGLFDPLSATFVRMVFAAAAIWLVALFRGEIFRTLAAPKSKEAVGSLLGASLLGPTIGVWLSLVAVKHTAAGIAATLISTFPVMVIPLAMIFHKERPTYRSLWGTIVAVCGVALLFIE